MANGRLASNPFTAFAIGFKDPAAPGRFRAEQAQLQQQRAAKQLQAKLGAAQLVLQNPAASEAQIQEATSVFAQAGMSGLAKGLIPAKPKKATIIQPGQEGIPEGFVGIRGPKGQLTLKRTAAEEETTRFQPMTAVHRGSGATMRARFDPIGGVTTDETGNVLGPEWVTTKTTITAPTPGAITETQQGKSEVQLRQERVATTQALNTSDRMIRLVEQNPAAFTTGANLAGFVDTLGTATQSMLFALGVDTALSQSNPLDYPDEFWGPLINASDEGKQLAFVLALQLAAAQGLGEGRALTDKDIQRAIKLVGTDVQSPERVKARLKSNQRTLMEHHNIARDIILGPGNDIFQDRLKEFGDAGAGPQMTDQELLQAIQNELQNINLTQPNGQ